MTDRSKWLSSTTRIFLPSTVSRRSAPWSSTGLDGILAVPRKAWVAFSIERRLLQAFAQCNTTNTRAAAVVNHLKALLAHKHVDATCANKPLTICILL